jgi:hypothetical protein
MGLHTWTDAPAFTESDVEDAALEWFGELGYRVLHGPVIAPGEAVTVRASYEAVIQDSRMTAAGHKTYDTGIGPRIGPKWPDSRRVC